MTKKEIQAIATVFAYNQPLLLDENFDPSTSAWDKWYKMVTDMADMLQSQCNGMSGVKNFNRDLFIEVCKRRMK